MLVINHSLIDAVRITEFLVDPQCLYKRISREVEGLLFWIPITLWISVGFLVFVYW
jgi:hypothetical protein